MDSNSSWSQQQFNGNGAFGHQIFKAMSETCMELTTVKRQNSSQSHYKEVLQRLGIGIRQIDPPKNDPTYPVSDKMMSELRNLERHLRQSYAGKTGSKIQSLPQRPAYRAKKVPPNISPSILDSVKTKKTLPPC